MNKDTSRLELNTKSSERIFGRNLPSSSLQPYFSVSPVNTKFSVLGSVDVRKPTTEKLHHYPVYDSMNTFNPGNRMAPWSGYSSNVHNESVLRNQIFALQRSDQAVYVPGSHSDLYNPTVSTNNTLDGSLLFKEPDWLNKNMNIVSHDNNHGIFFNHTRQQLNELDNKPTLPNQSNQPNQPNQPNQKKLP